MTLVELLLALAITALLIAATAVAFDAALTSYQENRGQALGDLALRNCLWQMTSTIRAAWNDPDQDTIQVTPDGQQCQLVDAAGRHIKYRYDPAAGQLQINVDNAPQWHALLGDVTPLAAGTPVFTLVPAAGFDAPTVGRVEIRFRVQRQEGYFPLCIAAVPRNVLFH